MNLYNLIDEALANAGALVIFESKRNFAYTLIIFNYYSLGGLTL